MKMGRFRHVVSDFIYSLAVNVYCPGRGDVNLLTVRGMVATLYLMELTLYFFITWDFISSTVGLVAIF